MALNLPYNCQTAPFSSLAPENSLGVAVHYVVQTTGLRRQLRRWL
jgi:hypothetical protein